jgi:hypothetical protein
MHINHVLIKQPRVAAGFGGRSCFVFVTIVDEGSHSAVNVKGLIDRYHDKKMLWRARGAIGIAPSGRPGGGRAGLECGA